MKGTSEILDNKQDSKFICGVVEGFYGIPWTSDQRKLLFKWMNSMGMTTYMYAPKDDAKHRAFWRDLYSVEEAENLTSLIEAATENNVNLVYALSPGLDISFSSSKDTQFLKRKLEQVAAFGCKAFALLFDDIDPELSFSDKSAFQSSACAQVSITNEVFEHLGQPEFYFCPTEYCTSRAVPTLSSSGYLNTIGAKLLNDVNVLWTGCKVISKRLTIMELEEVSSVLKRPPVIWDNIHANDYDQRRIFLGPYDGRSPEIIPYIRGVLTNPNCEFESNYVPLHTLAQWSKSNPTGVKKDIITDNRLSPVASDIKLENENDYLSDEDLPIDATYKPKLALKRAIADWHLEFRKQRLPPKPVRVAAHTAIPSVPVPPPSTSDNTLPMYRDLETSNLPVGTTPPVGLTSVGLTSVGLTPVDNPSFLQPTGTLLVNSLIDPASSPERKEESDSESDVSLDTEPMECVPSAITDSLNVLDNNTDLPKNHSCDSLMQIESGPCTCSTDCDDEIKSCDSCSVSVDDLDLLIQLFYLPFEYGSKPLQVLTDFYWLKVNACSVSDKNSQEATEWWERHDRFLSWVNLVQSLSDKLKQAPNQAINYYFFPYLWDLIGVLQSCSAFVKWLSLGHVTKEAVGLLHGQYTWMTKDYRDSFLSGDQEPWCFNGGLQAEFQRMLPLSSVVDLLFIRPPDRILVKNYNYRPYKPSDETAVYDVCLKTCDDGMDGSEVFPEFPDVIGDKLVGPLLTLSPELCFVAEDEDGVLGYVVAAADAKQFRQKMNMAWLPSMCEKYAKPENVAELTPAEEVMAGFHSGQMDLPAGILESSFPSVIKLDVIPSRIEDLALTKRLLVPVLSALKCKGSIGVHVEVNIGDKYILEQYRHLGFVPLKNIGADGETIYLGRLL